MLSECRCRQLLNALDYLHHLSPPIIHRDLKCDNILINGSTGEARLGDFGLARARHATVVESVLGTPEFIAPELYEQHYNESVDVYAFGMCVLEMITKEYPFEECSNAAQIWRKVSQGIRPLVLQRIEWPEVRLFIEVCISPADIRPTARELRSHPFLIYNNPSTDDRVCPVRDKDDTAAATLPQPAALPRPLHKHATQQSPHPPVASSTHSQPPTAQQQAALAHTLQNTHVVASSSQAPAEGQSSHHPHRIPADPPQSLNLPPHSHSGQHSHDHHQPPDSALPAAYVGLTLNTTSASTYPARQSPASSPTHATIVRQGVVSSPQRSSTARPPSITTQQQPQPYTSPALRASLQLSAASSPHYAHLGGVTPSSVSSPTPTSTHAPLSTNTVAGQSPVPSSSHVQSIVVEVDGVSGGIAQVTLHIGLDLKRKKQIKFPFDFLLDHCSAVAAEMVRVLKLPDAANTEALIAVELESKLDSTRRQYFASMGGESTNGGAPHASQQQQQQQQQQRAAAGHRHQSSPGSPLIGSRSIHPILPPPPPRHTHHSPLLQSGQTPHTLASRTTPPQTSVSAAGSPPHSSHQSPPSTQTHTITSATARHPTQQSTPALPHPVSSGQQQQQQRASPPLLHTHSLSSKSSTNTWPAPIQRRSTLPIQHLAMPAANTAVGAATVTGAASDRVGDDLPHSASTPTHAHQQPHFAHHVQAATHSHTAHLHQPTHTSGAEREDAISAGTAADTSHLAALPSTMRTTRRLSHTVMASADSGPPVDDAAQAAQSQLRRSRSDLSNRYPTNTVQHEPAAAAQTATTAPTAATPHTQSPHERNDSPHRLYSNMTVAQLKDRIRAAGGASRLRDCVEKSDLVECLLQLSPPSPLPPSPNPSAAVSERLHLASDQLSIHHTPSTHSSRLSSLDQHLEQSRLHNTQLAAPLDSRATGATKHNHDLFADLFPPATSEDDTVATAGSRQSSFSSHLPHDTHSPVPSASPRLAPTHVTPIRLPEPPSPNRPAVSTSQRSASNPTSARSSSIRYPPHAASAPTKPASPSLNSLSLPPSSILPTDPFAHLDARQLNLSHSLDHWHDYFSDQADKQANTLEAAQQQHQLQHVNEAVAVAADRKMAAASKAAVGPVQAVPPGGGGFDVPDVFQPRTLNGDYHKQP